MATLSLFRILPDQVALRCPTQWRAILEDNFDVISIVDSWELLSTRCFIDLSSQALPWVAGPYADYYRKHLPNTAVKTWQDPIGPSVSLPKENLTVSSLKRLLKISRFAPYRADPIRRSFAQMAQAVTTDEPHLWALQAATAAQADAGWTKSCGLLRHKNLEIRERNLINIGKFSHAILDSHLESIQFEAWQRQIQLESQSFLSEENRMELKILVEQTDPKFRQTAALALTTLEWIYDVQWLKYDTWQRWKLLGESPLAAMAITETPCP